MSHLALAKLHVRTSKRVNGTPNSSVVEGCKHDFSFGINNKPLINSSLVREGSAKSKQSCDSDKANLARILALYSQQEGMAKRHFASISMYSDLNARIYIFREHYVGFNHSHDNNPIKLAHIPAFVF
jgi:hypothetical protein